MACGIGLVTKGMICCGDKTIIKTCFELPLDPYVEVPLFEVDIESPCFEVHVEVVNLDVEVEREETYYEIDVEIPNLETDVEKDC